MQVVRHGAVARATPSQLDPAPMVVSRGKDRNYIKLVSAACMSVSPALDMFVYEASQRGAYPMLRGWNAWTT